MYFHCSAYSESLGSVTNSDVDAAQDDVLQRRNAHLIMSEPFNLLASLPFGTNLSRMRFGNVALTRLGNNHLWPQNVAATIPSRPYVMDRRMRPLKLPLNEEITLEATTSAAGPAQHGAVLVLAKPQWRMTLPEGLDRFTTRATVVAPAGSATTWSAITAITFERDLFNGVYSVVGATVVAANAIAFRLFFPSQMVTEGRQLRPGFLVQNSISDFPNDMVFGGLGEWGRFHTFEPPSVQMFADAAGGTYEIRLDLVYLGSALSLLMGGR